MDRMSRGLRVSVTIAATAVALGLCGCAQQTLAGLRNHPNSVLAFEVPADCQTTYRRIVTQARERYRFLPGVRPQPGISAALESSGQAAHLTLWDSGGLALKYVLAADLRPLEPARTQVEIYCATRPARKEAELWQQWAATPLED